MSKIDCGPNTAPCECDCGHPSIAHVTFTKWRARCTAPGCICEWNDVCDCVQTSAKEPEDDASVLSAAGITVS